MSAQKFRPCLAESSMTSHLPMFLTLDPSFERATGREFSAESPSATATAFGMHCITSSVKELRFG